MAETYWVYDPGGVYFVTFTVHRCCREHFQTAFAADVPPLQGGDHVVAVFSINLSPLRGFGANPISK